MIFRSYNENRIRRSRMGRFFILGYSRQKIAKRILRLIKEIQQDPFEGIGKPEPLKHDLAGFWSRRITDELRMVYMVESNQLHIAQARYHY